MQNLYLITNLASRLHHDHMNCFLETSDVRTQTRNDFTPVKFPDHSKKLYQSLKEHKIISTFLYKMSY